MKINTHPAFAAFLLRTALGLVFVAHGAFKYLVLTLPETAAFFAAHGFPAWTAYPVFAIEVIGGFMLLAGVATRWAALALLPISIGALMVHWPNGWYFGAPHGGWEYIAFLVVALSAQIALGDGVFALHSRLDRRNPTGR